MAHHLSLVIPVRVEINETDLRTLQVIALHAPNTPEELSAKLIADGINSSSVTARRSISRLCEQGLISVQDSWGEDGARKSNLLCLTRLGLELLEQELTK